MQERERLSRRRVSSTRNGHAFRSPSPNDTREVLARLADVYFSALVVVPLVVNRTQPARFFLAPPRTSHCMRWIKRSVCTHARLSPPRRWAVCALSVLDAGAHFFTSCFTINITVGCSYFITRKVSLQGFNTHASWRPRAWTIYTDKKILFQLDRFEQIYLEIEIF